MYNKKNGVYYTPSSLAEYLAEPLINKDSINILDPSYGEGALLLAAERIFQKKNKRALAKNLFGCDTKPVNGLLKHLPEANLQQIDFFDFGNDKKFQTILMNPPYVRQQIQNEKSIEKYRKKYPELKIVNGNADLWAYFLIKSISHLDKKGNIGAILPWAFLQADYAKPLRKWLLEIFKEIKVLTLSDKFFEKADERVVMLWLKGHGEKCTSLNIASSKGINSEVEYVDLPESNWNSDRVFSFGSLEIISILDRYKTDFGFKELSNYAEVKIGVVSGAVDFFITSKLGKEIDKFEKSKLVPILTSTDEFPTFLKSGKKNLRFLIALKDKDHLKYRSYIKRGIQEEYNLRTHSKLRTPWYSVKVGKIPDAFFHYRISKIPYLLLNKSKVQSTNSIHRIYFKKVTKIEQKWILISLLSIPGQLSLETNSKSYGRGILKIEPKSLKNSLVIKRSDLIVNETYKQVVNLLSNDKKQEAVNIATEFINTQVNIPFDFAERAKETLINLQNSRIPDRNSADVDVR